MAKQKAPDEFMTAVRKGIRTKLGIQVPAKKKPTARAAVEDDEPREQRAKRYNYADLSGRK